MEEIILHNVPDIDKLSSVTEFDLFSIRNSISSDDKIPIDCTSNGVSIIYAYYKDNQIVVDICGVKYYMPWNEWDPIVDITFSKMNQLQSSWLLACSWENLYMIPVMDMINYSCTFDENQHCIFGTVADVLKSKN